MYLESLTNDHLSVYLNVHMLYLTTTNLRTQSSELVKLLQKGSSVSLVHRSQVIGIITPQTISPPVITDTAELEKLFAKIKPTKIFSKAKKEKVYSQHLKQKYG